MATIYATCAKLAIQKAPHIIEREKREAIAKAMAKDATKDALKDSTKKYFTQQCGFFNTAKGCTNPDCKFIHEKSQCAFFNTPNGCWKGDLCPFSHVKNEKNIPKPFKMQKCAYFTTPAGCKKGEFCTFLHDIVQEKNEFEKDMNSVLKDIDNSVLKEQQSELTEDKKKQQYGDKLYPLVHQKYPQLVSRITGMLIECSLTELEELISSEKSLEERLDEAINVLNAAGIFDDTPSVSPSSTPSVSPMTLQSESYESILTPLVPATAAVSDREPHQDILVHRDESMYELILTPLIGDAVAAADESIHEFPEEEDLILDLEIVEEEIEFIENESNAMETAIKKLVSDCLSACGGQTILDRVDDEMAYVTPAKKFFIGHLDTKENMNVDGYMFTKYSLYNNKDFQTRLKKQFSSLCPRGYFSVNLVKDVDHGMAEELIITARKRL